ncbi:MAG: glutamyl-tRNA reductase [Chlorobi bacterium]|nr:glutamyl-tRNA reductase [Chlorobiota bacterium]
MIGLVGINFKTAPLDIREKFSLDDKTAVEFAEEVKQKSKISGIVVLSTCNRAEYYFHTDDCCETAAYSNILKALKSFCGVKENVKEYFYFKSGKDAYKHLFHVISGASSMVVGEDQIVGQVKHALQLSEKNKLSDTELTRLFTKSFEVSKKVRTQTEINKGAFSVSYAGVEKCMSVFPDIISCNILLTGAGETGELTLKSLIKKGCKNIVITNRTLSKAEKLSKKYGVKSMPFSSYKEQLSEFDIIIVSTGSSKILIEKNDAQKAVTKRNGKKQLYLDLSVPRNISNDVSEIKNIVIFDVDDLKETVNSNKEKRLKLIGEIDKITDIYINEFEDWLSARNLGPVISKIISGFSRINKKEISGFKKANKLNEHEKEILLENYGNYIAEKCSRRFIKNIKEVTENGKNTEYVKVLSELFELN